MLTVSPLLMTLLNIMSRYENQFLSLNHTVNVAVSIKFNSCKLSLNWGPESTLKDTTSKPNRLWPVTPSSSVQFRLVSIVLNNENHPELDRTTTQLAVRFWSLPLIIANLTGHANTTWWAGLEWLKCRTVLLLRPYGRYMVQCSHGLTQRLTHENKTKKTKTKKKKGFLLKVLGRIWRSGCVKLKINKKQTNKQTKQGGSRTTSLAYFRDHILLQSL